MKKACHHHTLGVDVTTRLWIRTRGFTNGQEPILGFSIADHVDILGRASLNDLILRIAGGKGDLIENSIHSNILEYAERIPLHDDE